MEQHTKVTEVVLLEKGKFCFHDCNTKISCKWKEQQSSRVGRGESSAQVLKTSFSLDNLDHSLQQEEKMGTNVAPIWFKNL